LARREAAGSRAEQFPEGSLRSSPDDVNGAGSTAFSKR
jgi:hypothetical protein